MENEKRTITATITTNADGEPPPNGATCNITPQELLAILERALSKCQGNPVIIINTGTNTGVICGVNNGTIAPPPRNNEPPATE